MPRRCRRVAEREIAATGKFYCKFCLRVRDAAGGRFVTDAAGKRAWQCAPCAEVRRATKPALPTIEPGAPLRRKTHQPLHRVLRPFRD